MNNKKVIQLLDKQIGLAIYETDYRRNGILEEEYISEAKLKEVGEVLEGLDKMVKDITDKRNELIDMIKKVGKAKQVFFEDVSGKFVNDSRINLNAPLYLLGDQFMFSGCMIIDPKKYLKKL